MNAAPSLVVTQTPNSYQSPFTRWNESSWIRSKPIREDEIFGLPFSPDLVPLAAHHLISADSNLWTTILAYRLLAHLQFTTLLELNHVNPICSNLAQGQAPVTLTTEQQNDALRIYCDESGHALFVELFSIQVEQTFGIKRSVLGRPNFDRTLEKIIATNKTKISPNLIKLFFVAVSETLITKVLNNVPHDPQVASIVRSIIGDHAADEALHSAYFRKLFPILWHSLSYYEKEAVGQLLPQLVWAFLGPDRQVDRRILQQLGFNTEAIVEILEEVYVPNQIVQSVRQAAKPTLKMFEAAGVFSLPAVKQAFANYELV